MNGAVSKISQLLGKSYFHRNFTIGKLISCSVINGIGGLLFLAIQWPLVELANMNYLLATAIAGTAGILSKFVLNGLMTYRKNR